MDMGIPRKFLRADAHPMASPSCSYFPPNRNDGALEDDAAPTRVLYRRRVKLLEPARIVVVSLSIVRVEEAFRIFFVCCDPFHDSTSVRWHALLTKFAPHRVMELPLISRTAAETVLSEVEEDFKWSPGHTC